MDTDTTSLSTRQFSIIKDTYSSPTSDSSLENNEFQELTIVNSNKKPQRKSIVIIPIKSNIEIDETEDKETSSEKDNKASSLRSKYKRHKKFTKKTPRRQSASRSDSETNRNSGRIAKPYNKFSKVPKKTRDSEFRSVIQKKVKTSAYKNKLIIQSQNLDSPETEENFEKEELIENTEDCINFHSETKSYSRKSPKPLTHDDFVRKIKKQKLPENLTYAKKVKEYNTPTSNRYAKHKASLSENKDHNKKNSSLDYKIGSTSTPTIGFKNQKNALLITTPKLTRNNTLNYDDQPFELNGVSSLMRDLSLNSKTINTEKYKPSKRNSRIEIISPEEKIQETPIEKHKDSTTKPNKNNVYSKIYNTSLKNELFEILSQSPARLSLAKFSPTISIPKKAARKSISRLSPPKRSLDSFIQNFSNPKRTKFQLDGKHKQIRLSDNGRLSKSKKSYESVMKCLDSLTKEDHRKYSQKSIFTPIYTAKTIPTIINRNSEKPPLNNQPPLICFDQLKSFFCCFK
ncbi:hypothetical protein BB558_004894 [Smittium angustum]|uniref:Uncharacterized protein n=1 Tax=Smittium angustum TaxID=133377 RepID=A0A2U1IWC8_SMIAN|nr:hypothetical protein BB558_006925 [Smittium angustum]PVZ99093.1 hypothetical protein BB558_004894 [Smittium angustum]